MSTIFNVRNLKVPRLTRASVIIGTLVVIVGLIAAFVGWHLYKKLTTNTVVAEFSQTLALYPGDKVQIMGVKVGSIDKMEPAGDKMGSLPLQLEVQVARQRDRVGAQPEPRGVAGHPARAAVHRRPGMENNAVITEDRTQVPVEYDELRDSINRILTELGPTAAQPKGPSATSSNRSPTGSRARASRSTRP